MLALDHFSRFVLILVAAMVAPLLLYPIEKILPWPALIEELYKLIFIGYLVFSERKFGKTDWWVAFAFGVIFAISESFFYLINIIHLGVYTDLILRLILTIPLHVGTSLLIYLGLQRGYWVLVAFGMAVLVHFGFNFWIWTSMT